MSVLQDWVMKLPLMMQGVLIAAVRGPDGLPKEHPSKVILRWYRRCILISAYKGEPMTDPYVADGGSFTGPWPIELTFDEATRDLLRGVDECSHHFLMHLIHGAEIIAYRHPDGKISFGWYLFYLEMVNALHLALEERPAFEARLGERT